MTARKTAIPAFLNARDDAGEIVSHSFDAIAASSVLRDRLLPHDRARFEIAEARLRGEFRTAEDVVLTLDQWWKIMRVARKRGTTVPRYQIDA